MEAPFSELLKKGGEDLFLPANRTQTTEGVPLGQGVPIKDRRKRRLAGWEARQSGECREVMA